jgi:hypothetical protein
MVSVVTDLCHHAQSNYQLNFHNRSCLWDQHVAWQTNTATTENNLPVYVFACEVSLYRVLSLSPPSPPSHGQINVNMFTSAAVLWLI